MWTLYQDLRFAMLGKFFWKGVSQSFGSPNRGQVAGTRIFREAACRMAAISSVGSGR